MVITMIMTITINIIMMIIMIMIMMSMTLVHVAKVALNFNPGDWKIKTEFKPESRKVTFTFGVLFV